MNRVRFVGLDVHAKTIAVAVAGANGGEVRSLGMISNREIRKLIKRLEPMEQLRVCYEAGPTGYALYWQLTALGVKCEVVAPTSGSREIDAPGDAGSDGGSASIAGDRPSLGDHDRGRIGRDLSL